MELYTGILKICFLIVIFVFLIILKFMGELRYLYELDEANGSAQPDQTANQPVNTESTFPFTCIYMYEI